MAHSGRSSRRWRLVTARQIWLWVGAAARIAAGGWSRVGNMRMAVPVCGVDDVSAGGVQRDVELLEFDVRVVETADLRVAQIDATAWGPAGYDRVARVWEMQTVFGRGQPALILL